MVRLQNHWICAALWLVASGCSYAQSSTPSEPDSAQAAKPSVNLPSAPSPSIGGAYKFPDKGRQFRNYLYATMGRRLSSARRSVPHWIRISQPHPSGIRERRDMANVTGGDSGCRSSVTPPNIHSPQRFMKMSPTTGANARGSFHAVHTR
jgi:hypothetical protein